MEVWKPIKDYEGLYEISDLGHVRRLDAVVERGDRPMLVKGGIMQLRDNGSGYLRVKLSKNNKSRRVLVHRLIAEHFLDKVDNLTVINHKDGNKQNNNLSNLEWTTQRENIIHARKTGLIDVEKWKKSISKSTHNSKKVIDIKTGVVYDSISKAAKQIGIDRGTLSDYLNDKAKNKTDLKYL
ncbi:NUMOD4 domain-containing protein [Chryseobacterium zhengzhouense]|uniref:NUMOD4 domain-containing protein n=1 Tax=Chryseobacterium zhengzhouense TaxID=1636086 RepID=A0ABW2LYK8_9FLAO